MQRLYVTEDKRLMERVKYDIMSGPTLTRPEPPQRFHIKTDWSYDVI